MTADEEKELLELEAQLIRLKMLNNQYARHLMQQRPRRGLLGAGNVSQYLAQVPPETWKAFITPNTWQNKLLIVLGTALLAALKKNRR